MFRLVTVGLGLFVLYSVVLRMTSGMAVVEECAVGDDTADQQQCVRSLGFGDAIGNVTVNWNPNRLATYCSVFQQSASGGTTGQHCTSAYTPGCNFWVLTERTLERRTAFLSAALDTLCSKKDVLDNNSGCLTAQLEPLNVCFTEAIDGMIEEVIVQGVASLTANDQEQVRKRFGQSVEACVSRVLQASCEQTITDLVRRFLHDILIKVYEI